MRRNGAVGFGISMVFVLMLCCARAGAVNEVILADALQKTEGIARCADGRVYVGENESGKVWRIVNDKKVEPVAEGMTSLAGLACGPDNRVYAVEFGMGVVNRITVGKGKKGEANKVEKFASGLRTPNGIVVAKDGTVFVSESEPGRVARIAPDGKAETLVSGIPYANGLVLNADETVLYVAASAPGRIFSVALTGENKGKKEVFKKNLQMIDGLTSDADGMFYACLFGMGQVVRIAKDGVSTVIASGLKSNASPVVADGFLYVTNLQGKGIYKIPLSEKKK